MIARRLAAAAVLVLAGCLTPSVAAVSIVQPEKAAEDVFPGAGELFDRYIEALGGESAIREITSRIIIGSMVAKGAEAQSSQITTRQIAPDRLLAVMETPGQPPREVGFDGKIGWRRIGGNPPELVPPEALKQLKQTADIYQEANYKDRYKELQTIGKTEFAARPAWEVKAVDQEGKLSNLYFDVQNGLLLGARHDQVGPQGTIEVTMTLGDYKPFNRVLHATRIVQTAAGQEVTITYSDIRINPDDIGLIEAPKELAGAK